eukprot:jgi/Mesen1/955/ME000012S00505
MDWLKNAAENFVEKKGDDEKGQHSEGGLGALSGFMGGGSEKTASHEETKKKSSGGMPDKEQLTQYIHQASSLVDKAAQNKSVMNSSYGHYVKQADSFLHSIESKLGGTTHTDAHATATRDADGNVAVHTQATASGPNAAAAAQAASALGDQAADEARRQL